MPDLEEKCHTNLAMMMNSNYVPLLENAYISVEMTGGSLVFHTMKWPSLRILTAFSFQGCMHWNRLNHPLSALRKFQVKDQLFLGYKCQLRENAAHNNFPDILKCIFLGWFILSLKFDLMVSIILWLCLGWQVSQETHCCLPMDRECSILDNVKVEKNSGQGNKISGLGGYITF